MYIQYLYIWRVVACVSYTYVCCVYSIHKPLTGSYRRKWKILQLPIIKKMRPSSWVFDFFLSHCWFFLYRLRPWFFPERPFTSMESVKIGNSDELCYCLRSKNIRHRTSSVLYIVHTIINQVVSRIPLPPPPTHPSKDQSTGHRVV